MAKVSGSAFLTDLKLLAEPVPAAMAAPALGKRNLKIALVLFGLALLSLLGFEVRFHIDPFGVSNAPHFLYQAQSLLHGHLDLPLSPRTTDIVVVNGKSYIVYPPLIAPRLPAPLYVEHGFARLRLLYARHRPLRICVPRVSDLAGRRHGARARALPGLVAQPHPRLERNPMAPVPRARHCGRGDGRPVHGAQFRRVRLTL